jgi:hypothetical protein
MDWIHLAEDGDQWEALVNTVMNLRVPWNFGKVLSSLAIGGFSRRCQLHGFSLVYVCMCVRLAVVWTVGRIFFLFGLLEFVHRKSLPGE